MNSNVKSNFYGRRGKNQIVDEEEKNTKVLFDLKVLFSLVKT